MSRHISAVRDGLFGAGLVLLGAVVVLDSTLGATNASVAGPQFFPYLVSAGLILTGMSFIRPIVAGEALDEPVEFEWPPVLAIMGGLVVQLPVLVYLGWIPAAAILFVAVALAFGSRRFLLNALIGLALASVLFVGFDFVLGLDLPAGDLVEPFLP